MRDARQENTGKEQAGRPVPRSEWTTPRLRALELAQSQTNPGSAFETDVAS